MLPLLLTSCSALHSLHPSLCWLNKLPHSNVVVLIAAHRIDWCALLWHVLQAHLEAQWEEATLRATRVMNALEFIAEAPVRRCDVRDMLEKRARSATGGQQVCVSSHCNTSTYACSKVPECVVY
jgi:hypothetical protein